MFGLRQIMVVNDDAPSPPVLHELLPMLERALQDRVQLQKIIQKLAPKSKALVNKLRCAAGVMELGSLRGKVERKQKARKLISVFVQNGSMFHIQDLPPGLTQHLLRDGLDYEFWLQELRVFCLREVLESEEAVEILLEFQSFGAHPHVVQAMNHPEFSTKRERDLSDL
ncbi:hypothetical protein BASA81_008330 [Batrachochytrium salamandrivorans]|nr:hypothetical protein BASA81_008330 [Batrachochytrium salamandrivorans]